MKSVSQGFTMETLTKLDFSVDPSIFYRDCAASIKEDFKDLIGYFSQYKPSYISTPFRGNCMKMTHDGLNFIFASKEGRIASCIIDKKQLMLDNKVSQNSVKSLAISKNDFVYIGTKDHKIHKLSLLTLIEDNVLQGHEGPVTSLHISSNDSKLYSSSDDGKVMIWDLRNDQGKELYMHDDKVKCLDLSCDNVHIVSGSSDGGLIVYDLINKKIAFDFDKIEDTIISCVKISSKNSYLIAGDSRPRIRVWQFGVWNLKHEFGGHTQVVKCLDISEDESFFVSGGKDSMIKVWDLIKWKDETTLHGHSRSVKSIIIDNELQVLHTLSQDCKIMTSRIPKFENHINVATDTILLKIMINPKDRIVYAFNHYGDILYKRKEKFEEFVNYGKDILSWNFINSGLQLALVEKPSSSMKLEVTLVDNYHDKSKRVLSFKTDSEATSALASDNGEFLIIGMQFKVAVYSMATQQKLKVFTTHATAVRALALHEEHLFAGDEGGIIKYYILKDGFFEKGQLIDDTHNAVDLIRLLIPERLVFSAASDGTILIWSFEKLQCINKIFMNNKITEIYFTKDNQNFFVNFCSMISIFNIESLSKVGTITLENANEAIGFSFDEKDIYLSFGHYYKVLENPLKTTNINIYGNHSEMQKYLDYIIKIINEEVPRHMDSMDDWLIEPYHINTLHLYSFFNLHNHLEKSIQENASFFSSKNGYSPMIISIEKGFAKCIDSIYDALKERSSFDKMALYGLSSALPALNRSSYGRLHELYNLSYGSSFALTMPKFLEDSEVLPKIVKSKRYFKPPERFVEEYKYKYEEVAIEFMQSFVKINTRLGASDSLEFMKSLIECKNDEVYCSNLIKIILEDKWRTIRWLLVVETLLYLVYLFMVCKFALYGGNRTYLIIPFVINIVLFLYEILQMIASKGMYFTSFWNYIDMLRFLMFTLYCIFVKFGVKDESGVWIIQERLLIATTIFSLIRGISYFRIFQTTRWIIKLIFDVMNELWALIFIIAYTIICSSVLYQGLVKDVDFVIAFKIDNLDTFKAEWLSVLFILVINPIIVLNLYIAIVGDTFEKSQNEQTILDGQELAEMIYEGEILLICNRRYKKAKFLHVLREEHLEIKAQNTSGQRIIRIADGAAGIEKSCSRSLSDINDLKGFMEIKTAEIEETTNEILQQLRKE